MSLTTEPRPLAVGFAPIQVQPVCDAGDGTVVIVPVCFKFTREAADGLVAELNAARRAGVQWSNAERAVMIAADPAYRAAKARGAEPPEAPAGAGAEPDAARADGIRAYYAVRAAAHAAASEKFRAAARGQLDAALVPLAEALLDVLPDLIRLRGALGAASE
jgi:hypothetical protein